MASKIETVKFAASFLKEAGFWALPLIFFPCALCNLSLLIGSFAVGSNEPEWDVFVRPGLGFFVLASLAIAIYGIVGGLRNRIYTGSAPAIGMIEDDGGTLDV